MQTNFHAFKYASLYTHRDGPDRPYSLCLVVPGQRGQASLKALAFLSTEQELDRALAAMETENRFIWRNTRSTSLSL